MTAAPSRIVAVTGGRNFGDADCVAWALGSLHAALGIRLLVHGGATGADTLADAWCRLTGVPCQPFRLTHRTWNAFGRVAGPLRNAIMLDSVAVDVLVAFPGGAGTADCVAAAKARGVRVWQVEAAWQRKLMEMA